MTEDDRNGHPRTAQVARVAVTVEPSRGGGRGRGRFGRRRRRPRRGRIRWPRLLAILVPVSFLAVISFVFGIVLAYEPPDPGADRQTQCSVHKRRRGLHPLRRGEPADRDPHLRHAGLPAAAAHPPDHAGTRSSRSRTSASTTEPGVDLKGIVRAFLADVVGGGGRQGASTITEQFVEAGAARGDRTARCSRSSARPRSRSSSRSRLGASRRSSPTTSTPPTSATAPTVSRPGPAPTSATTPIRTSTAAASRRGQTTRRAYA